MPYFTPTQDIISSLQIVSLQRKILTCSWNSAKSKGKRHVNQPKKWKFGNTRGCGTAPPNQGGLSDAHIFLLDFGDSCGWCAAGRTSQSPAGILRTLQRIILFRNPCTSQNPPSWGNPDQAGKVLGQVLASVLHALQRGCKTRESHRTAQVWLLPVTLTWLVLQTHLISQTTV